MHLDTRVVGVPEGAVAEAVGEEVGVEFAVEAGEDIAIEGGGDSRAIVVGGEESGDGFGVAGREIRAEDERVAGLEVGAKADEDVAGLCGGEVADAGADVEREDFGAGLAVDADRVGDVVGDVGLDLDSWNGAFDL